MNEIIDTYTYRNSLLDDSFVWFAAGVPIYINIIALLIKAGMFIYLFILLVKLGHRGIKLLDLYINEKTK